jgi:hypothetical protein
MELKNFEFEGSGSFGLQAVNISRNIRAGQGPTASQFG